MDQHQKVAKNHNGNVEFLDYSTHLSHSKSRNPQLAFSSFSANSISMYGWNFPAVVRVSPSNLLLTPNIYRMMLMHISTPWQFYNRDRRSHHFPSLTSGTFYSTALQTLRRRAHTRNWRADSEAYSAARYDTTNTPVARRWGTWQFWYWYGSRARTARNKRTPLTRRHNRACMGSMRVDGSILHLARICGISACSDYGGF